MGASSPKARPRPNGAIQKSDAIAPYRRPRSGPSALPTVLGATDAAEVPFSAAMGVEQHEALIAGVIDKHRKLVANAAVRRRTDGAEALGLCTCLDARRQFPRDRRRLLAVDFDEVILRLAAFHLRDHLDAPESRFIESGILGPIVQSRRHRTKR